MGGLLSHEDSASFSRIAERVNSMTVAQLVEEVGRVTVGTVELDDTVEVVVQKLARSSSGACVVLDKGRLVATVDLFSVLAYMLRLFEGTLQTREQKIVHEYYDPWYWDSFRQWVEKRVYVTQAPNASQLVAAGATQFFSESCRDIVTNADLVRYTRVTPVSLAISSDALVAQLLPLVGGGYNNVLVKTVDKETQSIVSYNFLTANGLLQVLYNAVLRTNLQGLGSRKLKDLKLNVRHAFSCRNSDLAIMTFRKMSHKGVSSVPVVSEGRVLLSELSLQTLQGITSANFGDLLGTVGHLLQKVDPRHDGVAVPITCRRKAKLSDVFELMWKHQRTHIWVVDKGNVIEGVVSLRDIVSFISTGVQNEGSNDGDDKKKKKKEKKKKQEKRTPGPYDYV